MRIKLTSSILLALAATMLIVAPAMAYLYRSQVAISENASGSYTVLPVLWDSANEWMEDNGFFGTGANTTRIQTLGGLNKPHMVTNNRTLTAIPVPANSQSNLYFVTGESERAMSIIAGNGGYVTTSDNSNLELGDNFTLTYTGWVNTALGSSLNATPASTLLSENGTVLWNASQLVDGNVATQGFHTDTTGIGSWGLLDYGPDWRAL